MASLKDQCWGHLYTSSMLMHDLCLHVDNHMICLQMITGKLHDRITNLNGWHCLQSDLDNLKVDQTVGKFPVTPVIISVN